MEYLTLQDIPHRHCSTVHSHKMAPQSSERSAGHMAAVCNIYSSDSPLSSSPHHLLLPPHQPLVCYAYASPIASNNEQQPPPALKEITLPELSKRLLPHHTYAPQDTRDKYFLVSLEGDADPSKPANLLSATQPGDLQILTQHLSWYNAKTRMQTHLQRSSPPLQPGEQNFPGKLPSFDEVSIKRVLQLSHANFSSLFKQPSRGHHHTHLPGGMSLQKTPRACDHSLTT